MTAETTGKGPAAASLAAWENEGWKRVDALLRRAADRKLQLGGGHEADRLLREAEALAASPEFADELGDEALARRYRARIAYRRALVHLRRARTAEDLRACEERLARASRQADLGPWPRAYRVAALTRLAALLPPAERPAVEAAAARAWHHLADEAAWREAEGRALQRPWLNLVELLGVAAGLDLARLSGQGAPEGGPVVHLLDRRGPRAFDAVGLDRESALRLAASRARAGALALHARDPDGRDLRRWQAEDGWTEPRRDRQAHRIAWLLGRHGSVPVTELQEAGLVGEGAAAVRQARRRLRDLLAEAAPREAAVDWRDARVVLGSGVRILTVLDRNPDWREPGL